MGTIRRRVTIPLAGNILVDLSPFDRFAGRGGRLAVAVTGVAAEANGELTMTVLVGSDILIDAGEIGAEASVNRGPDDETRRIRGRGAPADPITVRLFNTNAAARDVIVDAEIENA